MDGCNEGKKEGKAGRTDGLRKGRKEAWKE